MSKLMVAVLLMILTGCSKPVSYEEANPVIEACSKAGMQFQIRGSYIQCWKDK